MYQNYILVLGGSGFVGQNLCAKLVKNKSNYVICADKLPIDDTQLSKFAYNLNFEFANCDITNSLDFLDFYPINQIYCLTCYSKSQADVYNGLKNVVGFAKKKDSKLLITTSPITNGKSEMCIQKGTYWGQISMKQSGLADQNYIRNFMDYEGIPCKIAIVYDVYGPESTPNNIVNYLIKTSQSNQQVVLPGNGSQQRSFCHVDDLIDGLTKFAHINYTGTLHFGNYNEILSMNQLANKIVRLTNSKSNIIYNPVQQDELLKMVPNEQNFMETFEKTRWQPSISLEVGIGLLL